jgi:hypothetical protein
MKGKPLKQLKRGQVVFGKDLNPLIAFFNAFINGEIVNGKSNELQIGDLKIIFRIKNATDSGGGNSSYRGEYEPTGATPLGSGPFAVGDIVRVSPTNAVATPAGVTVPGVYVCIADGPGETDFPKHPLSAGGETAFWQWLVTWPSVANVCNGDGSTSEVFVDQQPGA